MTQGGDDMSIEQKEAPGLVDEPTNDDELCGKEIAKLKAHIGMQITLAEMDGHETFNEWFHVYPSVERYEDNLHSAWIAGAASRNAKIEAQAAQIEMMREALEFMWRDVPMNDYAFEKCEKALAATDDLSGYILCEREPVAWENAELYPQIVDHQRRTTDAPLYRAKEQGK